MATLMIYGTFQPAYVAEIRPDPARAQAAVAHVASAAGCSVKDYFFATDDNDFYAFLEGDDPMHLHAAKCLLMAKGHFTRLNGDFLFAPNELLPFMNSIAAEALGPAPF
jgi:uncharacterized protein with GYD domain